MARGHWSVCRTFEKWAASPQVFPAPFRIKDVRRRVTGVLLTPYPPGIPLLIPGERFNSRIVEYLQFAREFNARFPGFETYVHGLAQDIGPDGLPRYYVDCVLESEPNE